MIKKLNNLIRRKNYQNFIKGGVRQMNYSISEEVRQNAISFIESESLKERLTELNNKIKFLTSGENSIIDNTTFSDEEAASLKSEIMNTNKCIDVINFKKDTLKASLDERLSKIDVAGAVKAKTEMSELNRQLAELNNKNVQLENKIKSSRQEYDLQMINIREKYNDVDIASKEIVDPEFSPTVIKDYKKERAIKIANQFLNELTPEKKQQILSENKELNDLVYVGENI